MREGLKEYEAASMTLISNNSKEYNELTVVLKFEMEPQLEPQLELPHTQNGHQTLGKCFINVFTYH